MIKQSINEVAIQSGQDRGEHGVRKKPGRPKKQKNPTKFVGFTQESVQGNYFRMPTIWMDVCASIDNLAELKVVQYVLRHTWGFKEYYSMKRIAIDEFVNRRKRRDGSRMDSGTGLSDKAVKEGLARAIEHGLLISAVDNRDRARIKKSYALKMQAEGNNNPV